MSRFGVRLRRGAGLLWGPAPRAWAGLTAAPRIRFTPAHARILWRHARPVLFLTGLCILAGVLLSPVSVVLGLTFVAAGLGALALCFWMLGPLVHGGRSSRG